MKNLLISTAIAVTLSSSAFAADSITILNTGSKTGGFSMQTTAYSEDLAGDFDVNFVNPGDFCVAMGNVLPKIDGPVLMPWASDLEAVGRDGGCVTYDIANATTVRYDSSPIFVCTRGGNIATDTGRVGHTIPADGPLARIVKELNNQYGTSHTGVTYNGSGDTRLALINGEVDYALLSKKHTLVVMEADPTINCDASLAASGPNSIPAETGNDKLAFGFDTVWLVANANDDLVTRIKHSMMEAHLNCESAIGTWTKCNTNTYSVFHLSQDEVSSMWETMVAAQQ